MIIVDASETKGKSLLPEIEGASISPVLEAYTGADLVISPLNMPGATVALLEKHRDANALFVQGKWSMNDLEASVVDGRLMNAIAKMVAFNIPSACRVLLYVGDVPPVKSREWSALSKFQDRGGRVELPLSSWDDVVTWCHVKERHLKEYQNDPLVWVFTEGETITDNGMLQIPLEVPKGDPRRAAIQCPGIGPTLVNRWWAEVRQRLPRTATTFDLLVYMSEDPPTTKVEGYGKGKLQAFRQWLGLCDGFNLGLRKEP